jgi:hypothetical protein
MLLIFHMQFCIFWPVFSSLLSTSVSALMFMATYCSYSAHFLILSM